MSWESFYLVVSGRFSLQRAVVSGGLRDVLHLPGLHVHRGPWRPAGGRNSPINFGTIVTFLAWFGGTGYLLTRYSSIWALLALGFAVRERPGRRGAVFWFLFKVLLADEKELDPADYDMVGVLGRVSSPVRQGGTGEMIFSQDGDAASAAIRSENGETIAKGEEVVVTRFEKGIAYVRRWEELSRNERSAFSGSIRRIENAHPSGSDCDLLGWADGSGGHCSCWRCSPGCTAKPDRNEALVVYGFRGTRIVKGRGTFIFPMMETYRELSLELMSFDVAPQQDLYTKQGVAVTVEAVAQIKVKSDPESIQTAVGAVSDQDRSGSRGADPAGDGRPSARHHRPAFGGADRQRAGDGGRPHARHLRR